MKKMIIKNTAEILNTLTEILLEDVIELPSYQRDVYMYVDADGIASLELYVNVGGNSWLNDDHVTLYTLRERCITMWEAIDSIDTLVDATDMPWDLLVSMTNTYFDDMVDAEDIDLCDVLVMCRHTDEIVDRVAAWYREYVCDNETDACSFMAAEIMLKYDRDLLEVDAEVNDYIKRGLLASLDTEDDEIAWLFDEEVIPCT